MTKLELTWDDKTYFLDALYSIPDEDPLTIHVSVARKIQNKAHLGNIGTDSDAPAPILCKLGRGAADVQSLKEEHAFYMGDLCILQGEVVPKCFGFYHATVDEEPLGCLLLEYCADDRGRGRKKVDYEECNRLTMMAACKIHQAGIEHGDLVHQDSGRHIVMMDGSPRIVDFSSAKRHNCLNHAPNRPRGMFLTASSCSELVAMEGKYGDSVTLPERKGLLACKF